ncbi:MAG: motility protein A [Phycisphaeraceae bacterium]
MDIGMLFGLLGTWALVMWAIVLGGSPAAYIDVPSMILVVGGTFTIVFYCYPPNYVLRLPKAIIRAVKGAKQPIEQLITDLVRFAEIARRDGILSLENALKEIKDPFLVRGIQMAVDGTDPEMIESILTAELDHMSERHDSFKAVIDAVGKYAPAMGMIGTLVGLVVMLQNMEDPSKIGPGMAVALLTTLYGALIANAVTGPLGDRLARRSTEEALYKTIVIKGVMSIQSGDNPRIVEQKLKTFLPPGVWKGGQEERAA